MFAAALCLTGLALAGCGPSGPPPAPQSEAVTAPEPEVADPAIVAALAALPAPYNEANYANGKRIGGQCRACHTLNDGGGTMVGPNLHGIFGRKAGTVAGFDYSHQLKAAGFTWDWDKLDQWLAQPQTFVPGTRMTFAGVRKPEDRRDVIAYIEIETKR